MSASIFVIFLFAVRLREKEKPKERKTERGRDAGFRVDWRQCLESLSRCPPSKQQQWLPSLSPLFRETLLRHQRGHPFSVLCAGVVTPTFQGAAQQGDGEHADTGVTAPT